MAKGSRTMAMESHRDSSRASGQLAHWHGKWMSPFTEKTPWVRDSVGRSSRHMMLGAILFALLLSGCEPFSVQARLPDYLGEEFATSSGPGPAIPAETDGPTRVAISIVSDDAARGAAPRLSAGMLSIMEKHIIQDCQADLGITVADRFPIHGLDPQREALESLTRIREQGIPYWLLIVFSSADVESPASLGEETMMTQMPGTAIENFALAEVAIVDTDTKQIVVQAIGEGSESMELLTVPIGVSAGRSSGDPASQCRDEGVEAGLPSVERSLEVTLFGNPALESVIQGHRPLMLVKGRIGESSFPTISLKDTL